MVFRYAGIGIISDYTALFKRISGNCLLQVNRQPVFPPSRPDKSGCGVIWRYGISKSRVFLENVSNSFFYLQSLGPRHQTTGETTEQNVCAHHTGGTRFGIRTSDLVAIRNERRVHRVSSKDQIIISTLLIIYLYDDSQSENLVHIIEIDYTHRLYSQVNRQPVLYKVLTCIGS